MHPVIAGIYRNKLGPMGLGGPIAMDFSVSDARSEQLAEDGLHKPPRHDGAVAYNQALVFRRTGPFISIVTILGAALFVAGFWTREPAWLLLLWFAAAFLPFLYLLRIYLTRRGRLRSGEVPLILRRAKLLCGYTGLYWAVAVGVFFTLDSIPHLFLLAIAIGVMTAVGAGIYHVLPQACIVLILPPILALTGAFALNDDTAHVMTGLMVLLYGIVLLGVASYGYRRFSALICAETAVEAARADMADAMESSASAVGFFDAEGSPVLRNRKFRDLFGDDWPEPTPGDDTVRQTADGRWVKSSCSATRRGGLIAVHTDITALKEQEAELRRARDEAESANRTKSQFLAMMSHELRTPLNAVIGFAEILEEKAKIRGDEKEAEYAHTIHGSGRHLLNMIHDILDISKIEAGQYQLREDWVDLPERVAAVVGRLASEAADTKIAVETTIDPALQAVWADGTALEKILSKLTANAIKFTPAGGRVEIRAQAVENGVAIVVSDTGEGIEDEFQDNICDPFIQADASISRKNGGAGLGLPIVQRLVDLHGGQFTLMSTPGEGTTAKVLIPSPSSQVRSAEGETNIRLVSG